METRTPTCPRRGSEPTIRPDRVRWRGAACLSAGIHAAAFVALTLSAVLLREPPRVEIDEPIAVELVSEAEAGLRTPRPGTDLAVVPVAPEAAPAALPPSAPEAEAPPPAPPPMALAASEPPPIAAAPPPPDEAARPAPPAPTAEPAPPAPATAAAPPPPPAPAAPSVEVAAAAPPPPPAEAMPPPPGGQTVAIAPVEDAEAVRVADAAGPVLGPSGAPAALPTPDEPPAARPEVAPTVVAAIPAAPLAAPVAPQPPDVAPAAPPAPPPPPAEAATPPVAAATAADAPVAVAAVAPPPSVRPLDLREAVDTALKGLDCARVGARLDEADGTLTLRGHVPSVASRDRLVAALSGEPGIRRVEAGGLRLLGEPYCRILAFLDRPEFQRTTEQRSDLAAIGAANAPGQARLRGGEALDLHLSAPDFDSFLYVDHYAADGRVTHLLPTSRPDNALKADQDFALGPEGRGRRAVASPPYGIDVVVVLAASEPLVAAGRPIREDADTYLGALEGAVQRLRAEGRKPRYEYGYYLVTTEPPGSGASPAAQPARQVPRGRAGG